MQLRQLEQTLSEMLREEEARTQPEKKPGRMRGLFSRKPKPAAKAGPTRDRRSDIIVAGLGIALGLGCALFPWYIFFNQEKFGVRALKFSGGQEQAGPIYLGNDGERIGAPMSVDDIPPMKLDLFATGTLAKTGDGDAATPVVVEQPFPGEEQEFRLVHVANGRAMIEDDAGLWVVQRGSELPDSSHVASIEQRDGKWVLVTDTEKVVELSQ